MKQNLCKTIACCAAVLLLSACDKSGDLPGRVPGSDSIILDFSSGAAGTSGTPKSLKRSGPSGVSETSGVPGVSSRSVADNETESRVEHIDVLIFDERGTKKHYERIDAGGTTNGGTEALTARRSSFTADAKYWVYLIANGNDEEQNRFAAADFDRTALLGMKRVDRYLHLTGLSPENSGGVALPQTFLMDGVAYPAPMTEPTAAEPVVLNNGNTSENTYLAVMLRRAAVKLVLKIKPGERITFINYGTETGVVATGGYYMRNMPYTTSVVGGNEDVQVRTTRQSRNRLYQWTPEQITVTTYVYSHSWEHGSAIEREPRWILDIPLAYNNPDPDPNQEGEPAETQYYDKGNYYQIPVCNSPKLERNTCYTISLTLSVPGGTNPSEPVELQELSYEVAGWNDIPVSIGGEDERPRFLTLNRTEMEMHNSVIDGTTLQFASSSAVTATVTAAYYYNKFGLLTQVSNDLLNQIKLTPDAGLSGNITIESPVPTNNTIRYIEIEVTNEDGVEARKVLVKQYPLTYITNVEGWYSYRDDFISTASDGTRGVTTWELLAGKKIVKGQRYNSAQVPYNNSNAWICGCTWDSRNSRWTYGKTQTGFFASKVAVNHNSSTGLSDIEYARWSETRRSSTNYTYNTTTANVGLNNHRMYHVCITATSSEYTLGRPRITNGQTDGGEDNAKLVSPSFMLASQLGAVFSANTVNIAASHCKEYVEVARNGTVYDDWRLPTKAEVEIICNYQKRSDAMDEVLTYKRYWSASGLVTNYDAEPDAGDMAIRCIRDAYDDPEAGKEAEQEAGNR